MRRPGPPNGQPPVQWFAPAADRDAAVLARWRAGVGPPAVHNAPPWTTAATRLTIVSWNTALGGGDISRFVRTLPPSQPFVLLLQEVVRGGVDVPSQLPPGAAYARRHGGAAVNRSHPTDISDVASELGLSLFYVPSMRNGSPSASSEDRGNAILSSLPLTDLAAIELPFERQRRVALAATLTGVTASGRQWRLRVVDAHLDNTFSPARLWLAAEHGRTRQAHALLAWIGDEYPLALGGDFNTWSGFSDAAYLALARAFPGTRPRDRRATFRGLLRLDHLFFRLPDGWTASFARAPQRFGSDHFPLVGELRVD